MGKKLPRFFHCPTEFTLHMLGGKWKTVILCFLKERPCRYAELRKLLPKLSDKMLTERLHDLIASGFVVRKPRTVGPAQEYMLTPRGRQLTSILRHLDAWGVENARSFDVQVGTPLADLDNERRAGQTHDRTRAAPESQRGI
jgi:DNA-binding HxlR family transcriptional regulator